MPRNLFSKPFWLHVTRKTGEAEEQQRDAKKAAKKSDGDKTRSWAGATPLFGPSAEKVSREVAPAHLEPEEERGKQVPSVAKQPVLSKRKICLEQQANELLEDLARFIGTSTEDALNIVLRKMMANDRGRPKLGKHAKSPARGRPVFLQPYANAENREAA